MAGCTSSTSTVQNLPEQTVKTYYAALSKEDFNQAVDQLSPNYLKIANISREQFINQMKEIYYKNSVKWLDYQISEMKDIDTTHKRVKVLYKQNVQGKENAGTDEFLLVQENGKWMLDYSMVLSSTPIGGEKVVNKNGGTIKVSNVIVHKTVDGLLLTCSISNNTNNVLQTGWVDNAIIDLKTDKGTWSMEMKSRAKISPGKSEPGSFDFANADGVPNALTMKGIRFLSDRGLPVNQESHVLTFQL